MSAEKPQYINFDEYIRQGDPAKRELAEAWRVAIGLQAVDGLKTSEFLQETARRNIEGEITIDEVIKRNLQVVDMTASILARDNKVPMRVFALQEENSIIKAATGDFKGTTVTA